MPPWKYWPATQPLLPLLLLMENKLLWSPPIITSYSNEDHRTLGVFDSNDGVLHHMTANSLTLCYQPMDKFIRALKSTEGRREVLTVWFGAPLKQAKLFLVFMHASSCSKFSSTESLPFAFGHMLYPPVVRSVTLEPVRYCFRHWSRLIRILDPIRLH